MSHLRIVRVGSTLARLKLETLRLVSETLFPEWTSRQRERWVQAKLYIADRKPGVKIGLLHVDTSRSLRSVPFGLEIY